MFSKLRHGEVLRILDDADLPGDHEIVLFCVMRTVMRSSCNLHIIPRYLLN